MVGAIVAIVAVTIVSIALVICAIVGIVVVAFVLVVVVVLDVQAMVKIARNLISRPCNTFLTFWPQTHVAAAVEEPCCDVTLINIGFERATRHLPTWFHACLKAGVTQLINYSWDSWDILERQ